MEAHRSLTETRSCTLDCDFLYICPMSLSFRKVPFTTFLRVVLYHSVPHHFLLPAEFSFTNPKWHVVPCSNDFIKNERKLSMHATLEVWEQWWTPQPHCTSSHGSLGQPWAGLCSGMGRSGWKAFPTMGFSKILPFTYLSKSLCWFDCRKGKHRGSGIHFLSTSKLQALGSNAGPDGSSLSALEISCWQASSWHSSTSCFPQQETLQRSCPLVRAECLLPTRIGKCCYAYQLEIEQKKVRPNQQ